MKIVAPICDWSRLPYKDKRRAPVWRCNACGHMAKSKEQPQCPCKAIELEQ